MKKVDNFAKILHLLIKITDLRPLTEDDFFVVEIRARKKDMGEDKFIKDLFIKNSEDLFNKSEDIITYCKAFNARAYINLSPKSYKKLHGELLIKEAGYITEEQYPNPFRVVSRAYGGLKSDFPIWVIDVDKEYLDKLEDIQRDVEEIIQNQTNRSKKPRFDGYIVPTVSGFHLLYSSFNLKKFREKYPNIDVHKNSNGTLLYYEDNKEQDNPV